jgi:hypothetical protein
MRGGEWIVPVVVLIVWLISTILKSRERDEPVRPRQPGANAGRKPTGDIDRFLQEIDRLRRKSADEQASQPPRVRPAPPPPPRVRPVTRARQPLAEAVVVEAAPVVTPAAVIAPALAAQPPAATRVTRPSAELRQAPGVAPALHLLRSPRTLASAVVLHEVLGPPKCKRH